MNTSNQIPVVAFEQLGLHLTTPPGFEYPAYPEHFNSGAVDQPTEEVVLTQLQPPQTTVPSTSTPISDMTIGAVIDVAPDTAPGPAPRALYVDVASVGTIYGPAFPNLPAPQMLTGPAPNAFPAGPEHFPALSTGAPATTAQVNPQAIAQIKI